MPIATDVLIPPLATRLVLACLEALGGARALHQVRPSMNLTAFQHLIRHRRDVPGASIGSVRLQMPHEAAVEATAMIQGPNRWLACVVRLDRDTETKWRCSEFFLVGL